MDVWIMDRVEIDYLDGLLLDKQRLPKPVLASALKEIPTHHIQQWCVGRGVYQVVTEELLNWLGQRVKGKRAVEVCAGYGTIGRYLGITTTDSYMQTRPEIKACYQKLGQATIDPPPDVLRMDANTAVRKTAAEVVIGSWVTQKWIVGEDKGSVDGVDEVDILNCGVKYIHIGNDKTHGWKQLMRMPHDHHYFPWLISRAQDQSLNHVCVWPREEP